jgi:hypothetical protein
MSEVFSAIQCLFEEDKRHQFPYADCRKIQAQAGDQAKDLIPDLDAYFAKLAGYCSRGSGIVHMTSQEFLNMKKAAEKSFFEKHPQYESAESLITEEHAPDLFRDLQLGERMRVALLEISELHFANQST